MATKIKNKIDLYFDESEIEFSRRPNETSISLSDQIKNELQQNTLTSCTVMRTKLNKKGNV